MEKLIVIKIGGNIIDNDANLQAFLKSFSEVPGHKILVHGGGKIATGIGQQLGIEPNYTNGRRITDAATLELVTMVYGGLINKRIVARLQSLGCNSIGLTGCDGNVVTAVKRPVRDIDYGFVGDLSEDSINALFLQTLLDAHLTPVLAPLSYDRSSGLLNTNADTIAQEVAKAFSLDAGVQLIYCFEKKGLLRSVNDNTSVITSITEPLFYQYVADGTITEGMIPKLENAFKAIKQGVKKVVLGHTEDLPHLISGTAGTQIQ